ncbi:MAG: hypothetical protein ACRDLS_12155 [Solirubrobacteraceae bacterium]
MGITRDGRVRWRLRLTPEDQLPYAVCLDACPQAEIGRGRDGGDIPQTADGPRVRVGPPAWEPREVKPRIPVDRPIFPGPVPARLAIARPGGRPSLVLDDGRSLKLRDTLPLSDIAATRRVGFVLVSEAGGRQRAFVLQRRAAGWSVKAQRQVSPAAATGCISADGSRIGLIGDGAPRIAAVAGGRIDAPQKVDRARRVEADAGTCGLGRETIATAVLSVGSDSPRGSLVSVHAGRRLHRLYLRGVKRLWVSERTGTTAVLVKGRVVLIGVDGRRRSWRGVDVAASDGPTRLRLFPRTGRPYSRSF